MSAARVPLLCAFAGGCLSGAIALGMWRAESTAHVPAPPPLARHGELTRAALAANTPEPAEPLAAVERPPAPAAPSDVQAPEPPSDPSEAHAAKEVPDPNAAPASAGSAVSDVLTDLEAAYRQRLIAAARAEALAAEPSPVANRVAEPPREAVTRAAPSAAPAPAAVVAPAVTAPAVVASVAAAPAAPVPVAAPPVPAVPAPVAVAAVDSRPPDVHIGDINNTYITNVRQGDVILLQQQLAMMQYLQLLGLSGLPGNGGRAGFANPAAQARAARSAAGQFRQFPSTLTNPDNPWGFNFAPPNLVH